MVRQVIKKKSVSKSPLLREVQKQKRSKSKSSVKTSVRSRARLDPLKMVNLDAANHYNNRLVPYEMDHTKDSLDAVRQQQIQP